ncbi:PucR family transcriptional regulator [Nocardia sp. NBC_01009]|uniref:PucR family transcriptional regulator n=1 Tax=Nocardia sp. NBC_01009 TaxID=2975996 RepID=UPI0038669988|nr:PucR family transcriptional regulator ligand-binding domain-containing protein [Nocardia sp. NBC_01009]
MAVPVSWVLSQPDLAVRLKGGAVGIGREIDLVVTSELESPFRWLSGGELLLTTGMRLPATRRDRLGYLRGLDECGVAAVGFGTGLTHAEVPADLTEAADAIGIPLFEVPLPTPFAAIVERVTARLAQLQHDALLRASRAQPRMTRALVKAGAQAIVRELAGSLGAKVLMLDSAGAVTECHPGAPDDNLLRTVRAALAADPAASVSSVHTDTSGMSITHQRISVGRSSYGDLVVVSPAPLSAVDQILLGHANSLLALDFEKPARLQAAQHLLNSTALGLLLGTDADLTPAWGQLAQAADARGCIRVLVAECDAMGAVAGVRVALEAALVRAGLPLFMHVLERRVLVVLPAVEGTALAGRLATEIDAATRKLVRLGLSGAHPPHDLTAMLANAELAASAAERGGPPAEFTELAGRSLLSFDATRQVLNAMADTMLTPLVDYDRTHGTDLLSSLRAFLESNGQWESAAAVTGAHRHTLRKRIAMAQSVLGCDLDNARVRAELLLALLARGS